jgi:hypothetical protein
MSHCIPWIGEGIADHITRFVDAIRHTKAAAKITEILKGVA